MVRTIAPFPWRSDPLEESPLEGSPPEKTLPAWLSLSAEVAEARRTNRPIVALESSLIAQGLPWPDNSQTVEQAEQAVRAAGATPATIALLDGHVHLGLEPDQRERVARAPRGQVLKAGRRELAAALAQRRDAATTVSATLALARSLGLGVMATGGLGGVHRGASVSFDISCDLDELARADGVLVVCSGFKSILDLSATSEVLETRGVALAGYGTDMLPGFTEHQTEIPLETRFETPTQVADWVLAHHALGQPGALILTRPLEIEDAVPEHVAGPALREALAYAESQGIRGKPLTPFLLDQIRHHTEGASLQANRLLIVRNAALAGQIAVQMQ